MQTNELTLSAVIGNYNYARFVRDAVDSALAQEPPFLEVIVVDDGSTDESLEILRSYDDRIQLIAKENGGQISACMAGLAASSADYIYFLDSDDYVAPGFVAAILPALVDHPVKVQFQLEGVDGQRRSLDSIFPTFPEGYSSERMQSDNRTMGFYQCPPTSGNVFHRETVASFQLNERTRPPHMDAAAAIVMPYFGPVVTLDRRLAFYRVHGDNTYNTSYGHPTPSQLEQELVNFENTWSGALRLINRDEPPFGDRDPLFVLERKLMIAALENRLWIGGRIWTYLRRLIGTELPTRSKLLLSGWALALSIPLPGFRRSLVYQRRSPGDRSGPLKAIVTSILHAGKSAAGSTGTAVLPSESKPNPSN